ncbi:minor tail protein [Gordonia phage DatBoi]|nr:minor tail protein [Gordonia phage DatBoi]
MADITFMHVTGEWGHFIDDTTLDPDSDPDEVRPSGSIRFTPQGDWLPAGEPTRSVSVGPVSTTIEQGVIRDLQGREGVRLVATIGGQRVRWKAEISIQHKGAVLTTQTITFRAPADGSTAVRLNDVAIDTAPIDDGRQPTPVADLNLPTLGDYVYSYRISSGQFPAGSELYYAIGAAPNPDVRWDFDIAGAEATIHVPGAEVAEVTSADSYWLMFRQSAGGPVIELLTGKVRKK